MKIAVIFLVSIIILILLLLAYFKYSSPIASMRLEVNTNSSIPIEDIKVIVINLDRSHSRAQKMNKHLKNIPLDYERFSAVDGFDLTIVDNKTGKKFKGIDLKNNPHLFLENNYYTIKCSENESVIYYYNPLFRALGAGELGCYCSHRAVWQKIVKENIPYALILEDDVYFDSDYRQKFFSLIRALPTNWDIIYLGLSIFAKDKILYPLFNNNMLYKIITNKRVIRGTYAYMINQFTAEKLLSISENFSLCIDMILEEEIAKKRVEAYVSWPLLIRISQNNKSDIEDMCYSNSCYNNKDGYYKINSLIP